MSDPEGMERLTLAGYRKAIGYHTLECRAEELSQWIEEGEKTNE